MEWITDDAVSELFASRLRREYELISILLLILFESKCKDLNKSCVEQVVNLFDYYFNCFRNERKNHIKMSFYRFLESNGFLSETHL